MIETIKVLHYKLGYEVRTMRHTGEDAGGGKSFETRAAFTAKGEHIGRPRFAKKLYAQGIVPELREKDLQTCSIGFCEREKKWYGWSHRAICGFGLGDRVFEERFPGATDRTSFKKHGRRTIKNMRDARLAASRFAASVS